MSITSNQRVRLTKTLLQNALLKILQEKPICKISVRELCQLAEINRSTFYQHYDRPEDVLTEIADMFIAGITRELERLGPTARSSVEQQVTIICTYLLEQKQTATTLFRVYSPDSEFAANLFALSLTRMPELKPVFDRQTQASTELIRTCIIDGVYGMIRRRLLKGLDWTPEEIGTLAGELVRNAFL